MSCKHYWQVDRCNVETCEECGEVRDLQPLIDKALDKASNLTHPLRTGVYLNQFFSTQGEYYMQGGLPLDILRRLE